MLTFREVIEDFKSIVRGADSQLVYPIFDHIYGVHPMDEKTLSCQIMKISYSNNCNVTILSNLIHNATISLIENNDREKAILDAIHPLKTNEDMERYRIFEVNNGEVKLTIYRGYPAVPQSM